MRQPDAAFLATYPTSTYPWIGPERPPVCELVQLAHSDYAPRDSCENAGKPGWCYVEGPAAGTCPLGQERAIKFGAAPPDAPVIRCAAENP
jgi:hypothetical protein